MILREFFIFFFLLDKETSFNDVSDPRSKRWEHLSFSLYLSLGLKCLKIFAPPPFQTKKLSLTITSITLMRARVKRIIFICVCVCVYVQNHFFSIHFISLLGLIAHKSFYPIYLFGFCLSISLEPYEPRVVCVCVCVCAFIILFLLLFFFLFLNSLFGWKRMREIELMVFAIKKKKKYKKLFIHPSFISICQWFPVGRSFALGSVPDLNFHFFSTPFYCS